MKIILNNVERSIDEKDFPKYKKLGYILLDESGGTDDTPKPLSKMKKDDLMKVAEELGVEVEEAWTNKEMIEVIKKAQEELSSGGQ